MTHGFSHIATDLLKRPLIATDGCSPGELEQAESRLGIVLPAPLKEFYTTAGNLELFTTSFQRLYAPSELRLQGLKLLFMEEHQSVCCWAVDTEDTDMPVYQSATLLNPDWHSEAIGLSDFLSLMMYYQFVQARSFETISVSQETEREQWLGRLSNDFEKVADHNGLTIYKRTDELVWYFTEENSSPDELYRTDLKE